jgi:hypothetical protein
VSSLQHSGGSGSRQGLQFQGIGPDTSSKNGSHTGRLLVHLLYMSYASQRHTTEVKTLIQVSLQPLQLGQHVKPALKKGRHARPMLVRHVGAYTVLGKRRSSTEVRH